ncbi:AraC family transcriptional regulator [Saccharopolyspora spinosa]|uniref:AraC family transcriptional regulator n=1 Tax=Saccharopolyspora spinosa TaxID=60894 RepID=A0A2N3Y416_SACSN|nr:AraC family transcriptional regulator [Saccharopolyspora spinosa]PKW17640.1 AraC family transcriptional regulator [Saccharopolyspora spinosa]
MDAFGDLFRGVRAQGSLFGSTTLKPPWALQFIDGAPLTLCTILGGSGWVVPEHAEPLRLHPYETIIVRGPGTFTVVDAPDTRIEPIACGQDCAVPELGGTRHRLGWHDPRVDGATTLITGAYPVHGEISRRLTDALPTALWVGAGGTGDAVVDHLAAEIAVDAPGQQVVLDRLLDWVLVCTLRTWFDRPGGTPPAWWAAQRDPVVGCALRLLHSDPAAGWTVSSLAERAGVSRATLSKRFTELMDEPPAAYLTRWRMAMAADLLVDEPSMSVAQVAQTVGYADAFGFSAAFKRVRGTSPRAFRLTVAAEP